jgi:hypothetical protein
VTAATLPPSRLERMPMSTPTHSLNCHPLRSKPDAQSSGFKMVLEIRPWSDIRFALKAL